MLTTMKKGVYIMMVLVVITIGFVAFSVHRFDTKSFKRNEKIVSSNKRNEKIVSRETAPVQVTEKTETIEKFMDRYSAIHERRENYTRTMCALHRNHVPKMKKRPILLVNEKHKMVYCQTPKAGTVSWCRIMLILAGYKNYTEVMKLTSHQVSTAWKKHVRHLSAFPAAKQKHIMDTYTKFMFVRNPYTRLLSAFNDKFSPVNPYRMTKLKAKIDRKFKWDRSQNETKFVDFISMIIAHVGDNVHWNEMHRVCYPCDIHYDVIGRFEDMENEAKYILTLSNVSDFNFPIPSSAHTTNSSGDEKVKNAFSTIPAPHLANLYKRYKYDFTLFDYKIPL